MAKASMTGPLRFFGPLIWGAMTLCRGAALARADDVADFERYFRALECRQNEISLGANRSGAIASDLFDGKGILRVIQIERSGSNEPPKVAVSQPLRFRRSIDVARLSWTRSDDLLIHQPGSVAFTNVRKLSATAPPRLTSVSISDLTTLSFDNDIAPTQVERSLMIADGGRELFEFNVGAASVRPTGIAVGSSAFVRDGGDLLGRYHAAPDKGFVLELYRKKSKAWRKLHVPTLPSAAQLVLLRAYGRRRVEVAFHVPGYGTIPDRILLWREGAKAFQTIASGEIARLAISPSRNDIFGYFRATDEFVPIADQRRSPEVEFWLKQFAKMDGLIDFGFLDNGRVSVVKSHDGLHAAKIAVLAENDLKTTRELYSDCANVDRGVREAVGDGLNYLLKPPPGDHKNLVVYLHGGPVNFIGRDGSWLSDVLTLNGHPVVAVNYTGSISNWLAADERRSLVDVFGNDVANGVAYAERELGSKYPRPIIVANSFGSLVGLAAIASGRIHPSLFLDTDGVVRPVALLRGNGELPPQAYLGRYLARIVRDLGRALEPANVLLRAPDTRFVFLHGELDVTAPRADVDRFVAQFNALHPKHPAHVSIMPGMFHGAWRKGEYEFVFRGMIKSLATVASSD